MLVHPAHRGRGIARTLISVAVEHARSAGAETMVLLCPQADVLRSAVARVTS
ncbi:GNAT family N-acetyltransferase [Streptomyces dioscori]|uniref:GNAT family N-acetyltransferase n=1 Tax=Streptomyces dioscori TaxID=2109333 RepID=UPI00131DB3BC